MSVPAPLPELIEGVATPVAPASGGVLRGPLGGVGATARFGLLLLASYSLFFNLSVVRGSSMAPA